jgi:hypothetical protein
MVGPGTIFSPSSTYAVRRKQSLARNAFYLWGMKRMESGRLQEQDEARFHRAFNARLSLRAEKPNLEERFCERSVLVDVASSPEITLFNESELDTAAGRVRSQVNESRRACANAIAKLVEMKDVGGLMQVISNLNEQFPVITQELKGVREQMILELSTIGPLFGSGGVDAELAVANISILSLELQELHAISGIAHETLRAANEAVSLLRESKATSA